MNGKVLGLIGRLVREKKVEPVVVERPVVGVKKVFTDEPVVQKIEKDKTNEMFVTVGQSGIIFTSSDGNTWTNNRTSSGTSKHLYEVTYGNSTFVTVGYLGILLTILEPINETVC